MPVLGVPPTGAAAAGRRSAVEKASAPQAWAMPASSRALARVSGVPAPEEASPLPSRAPSPPPLRREALLSLLVVRGVRLLPPVALPALLQAAEVPWSAFP